MSRRWKIGLAVLGGVVALNLLLHGLRNVTGGTPGGPRSSSYATGRTGAGAYAELLARAGHEVVRSRELPREATLRTNDTAVVLGAPFVLKEDARALRAFVEGGGRLVAGGGNDLWLRKLLTPPPRGHDRVDRSRPLAPVPETRGVARLDPKRLTGWADAGAALPVLGDDDAAVGAVAKLGNGRAVLLADDAPLQNAHLARADNARLALDLAGPRSRRVVFFETYHGYGKASGLGAIPARWWAAFAFGALATLVLALARGRRFGPPEQTERELAPPRREYVEALAGVLARTRSPDAALAPLREEVRRRLVRRTGIRGDDGDLASAARRLGLADDEVEAVLGERRDVLAAGRALAKVRTWQG